MLNDSIQQFILDISHCNSFEACWKLYTETVKKYGILHVGYGILPTLNSDLNESIVHTTYPDEMIDYYLQNDGLVNDYMIRSNVMLNDSFVWITEEKKRKQWIEHNCADWESEGIDFPGQFDLNKSEDVLAVIRDFKIENGLCFSFGRDTTSSGVSLSATNMSCAHFKEYVLPYQNDLKVISQLFHQFSSQFSRNISLKGAKSIGVLPLTQSEIDTIKWLAHGFSLQAIADQKLFRSIESVNGYVRNAKVKLNANSRDQLIASAIILGII